MGDSKLVRLAFHEVEASPGFAPWLAAERITIAFTCGGRLYLVGTREDGSLVITDQLYGLCSAVAPRGDATMFLATRFQVWRLENALPPGERTDAGHERLFLPQSAWTTGALAVHDLALDHAGTPVFVNGRFSCLSVPSERWNFDPVWLPPFVSELVPEYRCHLSGIAMDRGRPAYATSLSRADTPDGWRDHRREGGVVVDVASNDVVCTGLSMPHSPRWDGHRLWLANGGTGELGFADLAIGRFEPVAAFPGFSRGLVLRGEVAVVGVSRPSKDETFEGLPLEARLDPSGIDSCTGVWVVDLRAGETVHSLVIHGGGQEILGLAVLEECRSASAVGVQGEEIQDLVTIP